MDNEIDQEIKIAELLIHKANQIMKDKESQLGNLKPILEEKMGKLKAAIDKKDIKAMKVTMDELQVPISQISSKIYEPIQQKSSSINECDSCQVSFKLPPDLLGPKSVPRVLKKKKQEKEEVIDADLEID